jgi:hypothetical protein
LTPSPQTSWHCPYPKATDKQIVNCLKVLDAAFPSVNSTPQTTSLKYQLFYEGLREFPEIVIAAACREYAFSPPKDGRTKFFPEPWELVKLCRDHLRLLAYNSGWRPAPPQPVPSWPPPPYPNIGLPLMIEDETIRHHADEIGEITAARAAIVREELAAWRRNLPPDLAEILNARARNPKAAA